MPNIRLLLPILYSAILFLLIRITNDIPQYDNYLTHTPGFIAAELVGVSAGSYLCFFLARRWIEICMSRRISPAVEYVCVALVPLMLEALIVAVSHHDPFAMAKTPRLFIIPSVVVVLMSLWLYLSLKSSHAERLYHAQRLRNEQLHASQLATELQLLRAQFHPHFLFNMLNTVYFRIDESNTDARDTVEHLANLLRSQLYTGEDKVAMKRELSALQSYIHLSSIRTGDRLRLSINIDPALNREVKYPHLLLPLVENAFKHCGGDYLIDISIRHSGTGMEMKVTNSMRPEPTGSASANGEGGMGLKNLRRRLELLYPAPTHRLSVHNDGKMYHATLRLSL